MKKQSLFIGLGLGAIAIPFVLALALYRLAVNMPRESLETWALSATVFIALGMPAAFITGRALAEIKLDGFLKGIDTGLEKVSRAVDFRDRARVNLARESRKAAQQEEPARRVTLPNVQNFPKVTYRDRVTEDVIDL